MKKIIFSALTFLLAFSLFGCSPTGLPPEDTGTGTPVPTETTAAPEPEIVEEKFVLESGAYKLGAAYTYVNDGQKRPTALLIAGSGPCDRDETLGSLRPLADIAAVLAAGGVNSLRVDKRTKDYAIAFAKTDGIEEEYLIDCRAALDWVRAESTCGEVWLLGHSLGGQMAAALAASDSSVAGLIIFNSTARHLAVLACDQYVRADGAKADDYQKYRDIALAATPDSCKGFYYYGATDYYWATYNRLDTVRSIKDAGVPTLIINSRADKNTFEADIALWAEALGNASNVEIYIDETMSHYGYDMDVNDPKAFLAEQTFPRRIAELFCNFINK